MRDLSCLNNTQRTNESTVIDQKETVFIVFFLFSFFLLSKVFAINLQKTKQRRFQMNKKVHMRDQAFNQVKDIMNAYKKKPCEQLRYFVQHLFQHYVAG